MRIYLLMYGALAQLGARYIRIVEVVSSNLICSRSRKVLILQHFPAFSIIYVLDMPDFFIEGFLCTAFLKILLE